jgi:uncharacterized membrane protein
MNRTELDAFVAHHQLTTQNVELALTLAEARPTPAETSQFLVQLVTLAGVLSLAAGLVNFVPAHWDGLHVAGRFALFEALLFVSLALALWRPPPRAVGRYALLAGFVTTGALLALFGQTYQTGANLYELFLTWAALGLPFILAGQWSVLWAAWVLVLNVAFGLFCGGRPEGGPLGFLLSGSTWATAELLLIAAILNLVLWGLAEFVHDRAPAALASHSPPTWLRRFTLACAIAFATWSGFVAVLGHAYSDVVDGSSLLFVTAILVGVTFYAARRRSDVFPLALAAASAIALVTFAIGRFSDLGSIGSAFVLALWLIVSSTLAGRVLMHLLRAWRAEPV